MKAKKIPMRSCVVTREKCEKRDLLRIVKTKENEIFVDESGKMNGRGAYIKKDLKVLQTAKEKKVLDRALETTIPDDIYAQISSLIKE